VRSAIRDEEGHDDNGGRNSERIERYVVRGRGFIPSSECYLIPDLGE
jgi:hypothetical protein